MKALIFLLPFALFALPKDLAIQSGTAFLRPCENHLHIKNSPHAILHWEDFSIGKGESVHFAQESAKSVVLNRVTSSQTSHLLGQLSSNGAVFLINPHGVVIGADALIQTGGFLASTANLSNENFLEGNYLFTHPGEGAILNHGVIQCAGGDIYLIAKTIENSGALQGENVSLISAYEVLLTPRENQKVTIRLSLDESEVSALKNEGASFYEKAIHHRGSAEAFGTKEESGRIYLIAQKGETGVEGPLLAEGGEIQVLGETVHLREGADLDVSGPQGGTILIGGDFQGKNKEILTAEKTTVENALLTANGTQGDGGKIIVWSENETYCSGEISASAIGETGNGGFLEISGRKGVEAPPDFRILELSPSEEVIFGHYTPVSNARIL